MATAPSSSWVLNPGIGEGSQKKEGVLFSGKMVTAPIYPHSSGAHPMPGAVVSLSPYLLAVGGRGCHHFASSHLLGLVSFARGYMASECGARTKPQAS